MADHNPFTLDMFGSSQNALSSGPGFGVTAFADGPTIEPDEAAPSPQTAPAEQPEGRQPEERLLAEASERGSNFYLSGSRDLAKGWKARTRDNLAAIKLATTIADEDRPATRQEQARLMRFTGFGASDLANAIFTRPGENGFRKGWEDLGLELRGAVSEADYASLARCTQYAHFTPEFVIRAIWKGLERLGWRGGRVLEPGFGTGLFPALMPQAYRDLSFVTGIEIDPVTARLARLLQPVARIIESDFARTDLPGHFDLVIGNPPFSDRTVRSDRAYRSLGLRLHDYFIARSIDLLKPGALAAFVTSSGTMDKADATAREHIAKFADLIAAIRLPEGSFRQDAGTDVVVDILFFRKRKPGQPQGDAAWLELAEVIPASEDSEAIRVNRWFADHPGHVLGHHATTTGPFGEAYTCLARDGDLEAALGAAILSLPDAIYDGEPDTIDLDLELRPTRTDITKPEGAHVREGSFFFDASKGLMQVIDGKPAPVSVRKGRSGEGFSEKQINVVRKLIPVRDAVRAVLKAQETDQPWRDLQVKLRIAWSSFVRDFGPINHTRVSIAGNEGRGSDGETRGTHRRPNLQPFLDDPDCWLVASIENYDLDTDTAKPGPIFSERVIVPPSAPAITNAADALAVVLNERGHVDPDHIAELLHENRETVIEDLGSAIYRDPADGSWQTSDALMSAVKVWHVEYPADPERGGDRLFMILIAHGWRRN